MPSNIELKARVHDMRRQRSLIEQVASRPAEVLVQEDTFFVVSVGRLKLRQFDPSRGELIFYQRPDQAGAKQSTYSLVPTDRPEDLRQALSLALGVRGVVRKKRWLYLAGQTRIHLDEVEGLGEFLELEVVLRPDQSVEEGERIAADLKRRLEIRDEDLIAGAYLDLMNASTILARRASFGVAHFFQPRSGEIR